MTRTLVFDCLDSEREYQNAMAEDSSRPDMIPDLHIGDTLTAIDYNLSLAKTAWYKGSVPHPEAMEYLRKIAALCVQAGEKYGMKPRDGY